MTKGICVSLNLFADQTFMNCRSVILILNTSKHIGIFSEEEKDFDNILQEDENIDIDEEKDDEEDDDSDHDTDIVEDDPVDETSKPEVPEGAKKLSLSRHISQMMNESKFMCLNFSKKWYGVIWFIRTLV